MYFQVDLFCIHREEGKKKKKESKVINSVIMKSSFLWSTHHGVNCCLLWFVLEMWDILIPRWLFHCAEKQRNTYISVKLHIFSFIHVIVIYIPYSRMNQMVEGRLTVQPHSHSITLAVCGKLFAMPGVNIWLLRFYSLEHTGWKNSQSHIFPSWYA